MRRSTLDAAMRMTLLAGVATVGLSAGVGDAAAADAAVVTSKGGDKVKLTLSGQITRKIHYLDDGGSGRFNHEDSNLSSSRIRFHADGKINADLSVAGLIETAVDDARNQGAQNNGTVNGGRSGNDLQTRIADIAFKHKAFGKLTMGSGDAAGNGIMNTNTNGTFGGISGAVGLVLGNNFQFRNKSNGGLAGANAAGFQVFPDFDFSSRQARIRYDTPVLFGFMASASQSDNQTAEVALRYGGTILDTKILAGVGYTEGSLNRGANTTFAGQGGAKNGDFFGVQAGGTHSSGMSPTRSRPCAGASSSPSPGPSTDVPAATRRGIRRSWQNAYDAVRLNTFLHLITCPLLSSAALRDGWCAPTVSTKGVST